MDAWDPAYDGSIHLLKPIKAQGTLENKIILAQIDTIAGNIKYNSEKIKKTILEAVKKEAEIIVFPKLSLFGVAAGDIPKRHITLLKEQEKELRELANKLNPDEVIVILTHFGYKKLKEITTKDYETIKKELGG